MQQLTFEEKDLQKLFVKDTPSRRAWRKIRRTSKQLFFLGVSYLFFFYLINFPAFSKRWTYAITPAATPAPTVTPAPATPTPTPVPIIYPSEIEIPNIGVKAPLLLDIPFDQVVERLRDGVTHYENTAYPGEVGNVVIVGHSSDYLWSTGRYKTIFALLDKLTPGDEIIVRYLTEQHRYRVTGSKVVRPSDLSVLKRTPTAQLTLITCYPVGTTRSRLIINAELVSNTITGIQEREPLITEALPRSR